MEINLLLNSLIRLNWLKFDAKSGDKCANEQQYSVARALHLQAFSCYQPPNQSLSNLQWCGLSFFPYQNILPHWFNPRYRNCDKMYRHIAWYRTTTAQKTHNKQVEKLYRKLQNFCFHFVFFSLSSVFCSFVFFFAYGRFARQHFSKNKKTDSKIVEKKHDESSENKLRNFKWNLWTAN